VLALAPRLAGGGIEGDRLSLGKAAHDVPLLREAGEERDINPRAMKAASRYGQLLLRCEAV
jgi:hypothetical protein